MLQAPLRVFAILTQLSFDIHTQWSVDAFTPISLCSLHPLLYAFHASVLSIGDVPNHATAQAGPGIQHDAWPFQSRIGWSCVFLPALFMSSESLTFLYSLISQATLLILFLLLNRMLPSHSEMHRDT
jgi:hypothetical protein